MLTPVAVPAGSSGQLQYNNAGAFGGAAALVYATSGANLTATATGASVTPVAVYGTTSQSAALQTWRTTGASVGLSVLSDARTITSSGTELILSQTGDEFGASSIKLRNRSGTIGALFEMTSNISVYLIDFQFLSGGTSTTQTIRHQDRGTVGSGYNVLTRPEFHFGIADNPSLITGKGNGDGIAVCGPNSTSAGGPLWWRNATSTSGSAMELRELAKITGIWADNTHASRKGRLKFEVYDTAARECLRLEASGSAPMVGFLGAAAVVRQTGGENVTNSVTDSGSTAGTIPDITDGTTYANDYTNLRRALYQIARMLKQDHDALRLYGLLT